jgi:hypothetical protein
LIADLAAFESDDGSWEARVLGPGASTAHRDRSGVWSTPAPPITPGELLNRFSRLDSAEAARLNWEAARALVGPEPQEPRATPEQLLRAAKNYRRRCEEAAALRLALQVLQRASMLARATNRRTAE